MPDGEAIEAGIVTRSIESAQRKVEARNFDIRKQLLEYDDVANDQRKVIYQQRNDILDAKDLSAQIASLREGCFTDLVRQYVPAESVEEQWNLPALQQVLADEWQIELALQQGGGGRRGHHRRRDPGEGAAAARATPSRPRWRWWASENFTQFERVVLLQSFDTNWRDHLSALDYLRQGIHLRGYAQKQPKQEYKREAFELFRQLIDQVKNEVTRVMLTVQVQSNAQLDEATHAMEERGEKHRQRHLHRAHRDRRGGNRGRCPDRQGRAGPGHARRARGPQRPLPLRQRQEVQAVPRQTGLMPRP